MLFRKFWLISDGHLLIKFSINFSNHQNDLNVQFSGSKSISAIFFHSFISFSKVFIFSFIISLRSSGHFDFSRLSSCFFKFSLIACMSFNAFSFHHSTAVGSNLIFSFSGVDSQVLSGVDSQVLSGVDSHWSWFSSSFWSWFSSSFWSWFSSSFWSWFSSSFWR